MTTREHISQSDDENDLSKKEIEVRLSDIWQFLLGNRRRILMGAAFGLLIGALYAFSKPNQYSAEVTVMPEIQAKSMSGLGGLGSLAGIAGINLDNLSASDAIRPDLYPNVLQSVPFALELLKQPVYAQKLQAQMPLQEFIRRTGEAGPGGWIKRLFGQGTGTAEERADPKNFSKAIQVTKAQSELIKQVLLTTSATYEKKSGILTIVAEQPDPVVAATVARLSLEYLTKYVTVYRTEKARKQVDFLTDQVRNAQKRYQSTEFALSAYRDRNRSLFLNTAKIEEQRLQADYILAQSVYNDLSKQLEQAKIKVQEETPVFKTLEPPTVPLKKSGPKRTVIMAVFAVLGGVVTLAYLFFKWVRSTYGNN